MRSLECWTSEPKRASLVRRCTSSVSAALSSASETSVASAARLLCSACGIRCSPAIASSPCVSPRTDSASSERVRPTPAGTGAPRRAQRGRQPVCPPAASSAADGRGLDRPRRAELGVGDDEAAALGQAEPGGHAVAGERAGGGERRVADVLAAGGGDEVGARGAEDPLARDGALLLADEAGHARHHEAEEDDRGRR